MTIGGGLIAGCIAEPSPASTIRGFLLNWENGKYEAAAKLTDGDPTAVATALRDSQRHLDAAAIRFQLGTMDRHDDTATTAFHAQVDLGENGPPWEYDGTMRLRQAGTNWKVVWEPSVIHPKLSDGERLAVITKVPERAQIRGEKGKPLVKRISVALVGVYPSQLTDPARTASAVARLTGLDAERLVGRVRAAPPKTFTPLVTLRAKTYQRIKSKLRTVPGLHVQLGKAPYTAKYAAGVIGTVGTATRDTLRAVGAPYQAGDSVGLSGLQVSYQRKLAGTPTTKVITVNSHGDKVDVLATWRGTRSKPVTTTLDDRTQRAAEYALAGQRRASLVAVEADTGKIRATAARPSITKSALRGKYAPFTGKYTPGGTFKVVSTDALLGTGLRVNSKVPCPQRRTVGGTTFRDQQVRRYVEAPRFTQVFGSGCDTAFAGLSRKLSSETLPKAAERYGIDGKWRLPVPAYTGEVPTADDDSTRAAQTIGRGGITMSPLGMALVAGAVKSGTWRPPTLVTAPRSTRQPAKPIALPRERVAALRNLTRTTVQSGSLAALNTPGPPVHGQVGVAPRGGHQVMSFIGYRGKLAVAVVVDTRRATGPNAAASIAKRFFGVLPSAKP